MSLLKHIQKIYKGNLKLLDEFKKQDEVFLKAPEKEEDLIELYDFGIGLQKDFNLEKEYDVIQNIITLKNVMVFAEINRYKKKLLMDMKEQERKETVQLIVNSLDGFGIEPVGYEIRENKIIVAWYLDSVMDINTLAHHLNGGLF
ncbi:hypothetical protein [Metabacillus litoralis]|uniref:Uncharacterized protein n=1 Tax=Metabacillus litoralis TaxID=152268 RepID=A0A179SN28_9BACI|nr:hypothetical protein [Metabacillus litoralis]OAS83106.1 hypothetical protein A6K24_10810 [Metabacillus litoralis]